MMNSFISITSAGLLVLIPSAAEGSNGISLRRYQSATQTYVDNEMAFVLESMYDRDEDVMLERRFTPDVRHRMMQSKASRERFATDDKPSDVERAWNDIVSHGWEMAISQDEDFLFLVCHSSPDDLDGNRRLDDLLTAIGKEHSSDYVETVHFDLHNLCVITPIQPVVAKELYELSTSSCVTLCPLVDVIKMSPNIISQLIDFGTDMPTTRHAEDDDLVFVSSSAASKSIAFSLVPTTNVEKTNQMLQNITANIRLHGERNLVQLSNATSEPTNISRLSLHDTFSITRASKASPLNKSARYWSRMLNHDIDCSSIFSTIAIKSSATTSVYEIKVPSSPSTEACIVTILVGLASHPSVVHVGSISHNVDLHNLNAGWVVEGSVTSDTGKRERPWSVAGLNGSGQIVSVSDTGLDVENCHFLDINGRGSIFARFDNSRRKVVRYDVSIETILSYPPASLCVFIAKLLSLFLVTDQTNVWR